MNLLLLTVTVVAGIAGVNSQQTECESDSFAVVVNYVNTRITDGVIL